MTEHNFHPRYRPDIDGLRALAILPVVAFHAFPRYAPGGFIGVDIFFVISGYLISLIIFKSLAKDSFSFGEFCAHRIKRLFPALLLVTAACYLFGWLTLLPEEFKQLGKHIAAGLGFVQNFVLWKEAGYFDVASELKPLMHLWSLAVEEQFYLAYPLFLWLIWKSRAHLLASIAVLCIASFVLSAKGVNDDSTKAFFSPQTRFWELLAGSILAYMQSFGTWKPSFTRALHRGIFNRFIFRAPAADEDRQALLASMLSVMGLLLIAYAVAAYSPAMAFPGPRALIPVTGALLLIIAGPKAWVNRRILAHRAVVWTGLISYPLYLWHWPLLSFARIVEAQTPSRTIRIAAVTASFLLAAFTYYFVEKKVRRARSSGMQVTMLCVLAVIIGYAGYNAYSRHGYPFRVKQHTLIAEGIGDWSYPTGLQTRQFQDLNIYTNSDKPPEVLLFGDSHIEQYGPRVVEMTEAGKAKSVTLMTRGGCPPIPFVDEHNQNVCASFFEKFWPYLEQNPSIKSVVISGCFNCYFIFQVEPLRSAADRLSYYFRKNAVTEDFRGGNGKHAALQELVDFTREIVSRGYQVHFLMDNPRDDRFDPANVIKSESGGRPLFLTASLANYASAFPADKKQVALENDMTARLKDTGAAILTQADLVCPQGICAPLDASGRPIYKDAHHMRAFFIREKMDILDPIISR